MKLSILVPGIRPQNWRKLYDSCQYDDFEMIFVGPHSDDDVTNLSNVKFIEDWGNPVRAMNIALITAEGEYIHWEADDAHFLANQPNQAIEEAEKLPFGEIITSKYLEGGGTNMLDDSYYRIKASLNCDNLFLNGDDYILNTGFIPRYLAIAAGGWDSVNFETLFFSHLDLAVRLQKTNFKLVLSNEAVAHCDHMPGTSGDHAPIHFAHIEHDEPRFREIYSNENSVERGSINIDNWKLSPEVWKRRFGEISL